MHISTCLVAHLPLRMAPGPQIDPSAQTPSPPLPSPPPPRTASTAARWRACATRAATTPTWRACWGPPASCATSATASPARSAAPSPPSVVVSNAAPPTGFLELKRSLLTPCRRKRRLRTASVCGRISAPTCVRVTVALPGGTWGRGHVGGSTARPWGVPGECLWVPAQRTGNFFGKCPEMPPILLRRASPGLYGKLSCHEVGHPPGG